VQKRFAARRDFPKSEARRDVHTGEEVSAQQTCFGDEGGSLHSAGFKRFKPALYLLERFQNLSQHLWEHWVVIRRFVKLVDRRCDFVDKRQGIVPSAGFTKCR
jgi:hypothetical protein